MGDGIRLDDEEFERLEELRRHGDGCHGDDDDDDYYALPPPRTDLMHEWTSWRTKVNDMMCDAITEYPSSDKLKRERDMLTSPTETKTPKFFRGEMSVYGQKVKDQYGGAVIDEEDDIATRQEKKIMEGNFYLFGIPRLSVTRCFQNKSDSPANSTNFRYQGSCKSGRKGSFKASVPEIDESRGESGTYSTPDKRPNKGLVRRWSVASDNPRIGYNPRSFSHLDIPNMHILNRHAVSISGNGSAGYHRQLAYVSSATDNEYHKYVMKQRTSGRRAGNFHTKDRR